MDVGSAKKDKIMDIRRIIGHMFAASGNANNGVNDGAFYVNSNYSSGSTNYNYGSQLNYCNHNNLPGRYPHLLVKYKAIPFDIGSESEDFGEQ